jgi:hypothetical protein
VPQEEEKIGIPQDFKRIIYVVVRRGYLDYTIKKKSNIFYPFLVYVMSQVMHVCDQFPLNQHKGLNIANGKPYTAFNKQIQN